MKSTTAESSSGFEPNCLSATGSQPRSLVRRGSAHKQSKLTKSKVLRARRMYDRKVPLAEIAKKLGISRNHACGIGKRRYWAWLPEEGHKAG